MAACAVVAEKYSGYRRGHITTRENFQFHFVNLEAEPDALRLPARGGLRPRAAPGTGRRPGPEFRRWREPNVRRQRQEGYVAVTVMVPLGNLSPEQFRGLA